MTVSKTAGNTGRRLGFIGCLILCCAAALPPKKESADSTNEGMALMQEIISRPPPQKGEEFGLLKVRSGDGKRTQVPVKYTLQVNENEWRDLYETQPAGGFPGQRLTVLHLSGKPNQYLLATKLDQGHFGEPALIESTNANIPLSGTDFWLSDLGLEFFHWPAQRLVRKEMKKSRPCKVVESINPNPEAGGYRRVLSWIDSEFGSPIRAEGYDRNNKLLKEFSIQGIKKVNGHWRLSEIEIRNEQTDSRTRLEFDLVIKSP